MCCFFSWLCEWIRVESGQIFTSDVNSAPISCICVVHADLLFARQKYALGCSRQANTDNFLLLCQSLRHLKDCQPECPKLMCQVLSIRQLAPISLEKKWILISLDISKTILSLCVDKGELQYPPTFLERSPWCRSSHSTSVSPFHSQPIHQPQVRSSAHSGSSGNFGQRGKHHGLFYSTFLGLVLHRKTRRKTDEGNVEWMGSSYS